MSALENNKLLGTVAELSKANTGGTMGKIIDILDKHTGKGIAAGEFSNDSGSFYVGKSQSSASQILNTMNTLDLVDKDRIGKRFLYTINRDTIDNLIHILEPVSESMGTLNYVQNYEIGSKLSVLSKNFMTLHNNLGEKKLDGTTDDGRTIRDAIILYLKMNNSGDQTVTKIVDFLKLKQAVVSTHLGKLRDAGLLKGHREGKNIFYSTTDDSEDIINSYNTAMDKLSE